MPVKNTEARNALIGKAPLSPHIQIRKEKNSKHLDEMN